MPPGQEETRTFKLSFVFICVFSRLCNQNLVAAYRVMDMESCSGVYFTFGASFTLPPFNLELSRKVQATPGNTTANC